MTSKIFNIEEAKPACPESLTALNEQHKHKLIGLNASLKQRQRQKLPKQRGYTLKVQSSKVSLPRANVPISIGNYCYFLDKNYCAVRDGWVFLRYYGDEAIKELSKSTCLSYETIADDLLSNLVVLQLFQQKATVDGFKLKSIQVSKESKIDEDAIRRRLIRLYERYHHIASRRNAVFYMSYLLEKGKVIEGLSDSHKKVYCNICFKACCQLHEVPTHDFDSSEGYNVKNYLKSYKEINEISFNQLLIQDKEPFDDTKTVSNELRARLEQNIEQYNSIIEENKVSHASSLINLFEKKAASSCGSKDHTKCGLYCYMNYLSLNNSTALAIFRQFIDKQFPHRYELFLSKLLQIFKYNPCDIAKAMRILCYTPKTAFEPINCYLVYIRLQSLDFQLPKVLTKPVIDTFLAEKQLAKKTVIDSQRLKLLKNNVENNKIIPYEPCRHLGFETCNGNCKCASRGFCEKFCVCNKQKCKLLWKGCYCKGTCNSTLCPCYFNNRECDLDLCQNCKGEKSTCTNLKVIRKEEKRLGVAVSSISGWGLYALEDIAEDDLIGEYIGEMIDNDDLNDRSDYIDYENSTYMFTLNDEFTIDSRSMGNILRYANHSKSKSNAQSRITFVNGVHKIFLFASANIKKHEEIFFDYDGQNTLSDKYEWINESQKGKNKCGNNQVIKTSSLLRTKRKRSETYSSNEIDSDFEYKSPRKRTKRKPSIAQTHARLLAFYKRNKKRTREELIAFSLKKKYASKDNVNSFIDDFLKLNSIHCSQENTDIEVDEDINLPSPSLLKQRGCEEGQTPKQFGFSL